MPGPTPIHLQRCFHHALREAVARCPSCGRFYCRECVIEHQGRLLCASCLRRLAQPPKTKRPWPALGARLAAALTGLAVTWLFFYALGALLISIPSDTHEMQKSIFEVLEE
ncbi:MAG: rhomboid family protein [Verrucomicrobiae bacterium]|nr:rhomboid family protein [Verrucomicrobiae bacterium]